MTKLVQAATKNYKVYLDNCCVSRPSDDQTQNRIQCETIAIMKILSYFYTGKWQWIISKILKTEINQNPDLKKRLSANALLNSVPQSVCVPFDEAEILRGEQIEALGFKEYDALHLACAESGKADIFLTTDDKITRKVKNVGSQLRIQVENPDTWLQEVIKNERIHDDRCSNLGTRF